MLPGIPKTAGSSEERHLRKLYRELSPQDQATLLRFAEFLAAGKQPVAAPPETFPDPEPIPRPAQESVIKAIKRLTATYPMIGRDRLLNETSSLMTAHVLHGKPAVEVIDELEALFLRHYEEMKAAFAQR